MKLAVFDVDNVLVRGQSQYKFAWFLFLKRKISFFLIVDIFYSFFLYKTGILRDLTSLREKAFYVVKGVKIEDFDELCRIFYEQVLRKDIIRECVDILDEHKRQGTAVVLLSASLYPLIRLLSDDLDVLFCIATRLENIKGILTGRVEGRIPYGMGKVECIKEYISGNDFDLTRSFVYADHISDLDVMLMFGRPVAVNPDHDLLKIAKDRGWEVKEF